MSSALDAMVTLSKSLVQFILIIYPSYKSYKALESKRIADAHEMLVFWSMSAFIQSLQLLADELLSKYSSKTHYRSVWIILKLMPIIIGPSRLYRYLIKPIYKANESTVDALVNDATSVQNKTVETLKEVGEVAAQTAHLTFIAPIETLYQLKNDINQSMKNTADENDRPQLLSTIPEDENESEGEEKRIIEGKNIPIEGNERMPIEGGNEGNHIKEEERLLNQIISPEKILNNSLQKDVERTDEYDLCTPASSASLAGCGHHHKLSNDHSSDDLFESDLNRRINARSLCSKCQQSAHNEFNDLKSKGIAVQSPILPRHSMIIGEESFDPLIDSSNEMAEQGLINDECDDFGLKRRKFGDGGDVEGSIPSTSALNDRKTKLIEAKTNAAAASD